MKNRVVRISCAVTLFLTCASLTAHAARKKKNIHKSPPDLTQSGKPDDTHDWRLGPLGANGWLFSRVALRGASRESRQILITNVDKGGPCDGKLQVNDVIVGIGSELFSYDARKELAKGIDEAEKRANKGRLALMIWRQGKIANVVITLPIMGSYSTTAPYECAKTKKLIDLSCEYLKNQEIKEGWLGHITALGLLSSGREDVMPQVKAYARSICKPGEVLNVETHVSMTAWWWSYKCLFLSEYYLATKDEYVLPTINEYATKLAMGQSGVGTWGHAVAARANTGKLHGHLGGYGAINQMGLTAMLALCLAEKCGITNSEVKQAIKRGSLFFSYYIGKGSIPYGDHEPAKPWFDDNGKSGAAAVLFDLLDNKDGAEFFSSMVVASAPCGRESGHTGHFWSHLWGGVGAARSGKAGLAAFTKRMNGPYTLSREGNGRVVFQENVGEKAGGGKNGGIGDLKTKFDCTGARLLHLCVPRRKLYLTGRGMTVKNPVSGARIAELFHVNRMSTDLDARNKLKRTEIMHLLCDPLPAVREVAVKAIQEHEIKCVDELIAMLDSDNKYTRYGACDALREAGYASEKAVAKLVALVETSDDLVLRLLAIDALTGGDRVKGLVMPAKAAIPALLKLAVSRSDDDPRRLLQRKLASKLFYDGNVKGFKGLMVVHGIDGVDRKLLIPAIQEFLTVDDGRSRSCLSWTYPRLTDDDLKLLWGDIYRATRDLSPSGIMFADGIRMSGLKFMQQHNIEEGVDLCISILQEDRWGGGRRRKTIIPMLAKYGSAAQKAVPALKELRAKYTSSRKYKSQLKAKDGAKRDQVILVEQIDQVIKTIETSKKHLPLKSYKASTQAR